jgi:N-acetyl-gamma-glutamylphosphate reductase
VREAKISTASGGGEGVDHREPLAIIGGTGYVGRSLALHLLGHPTFRLGAIVGSSATVGKPFSAVFEKKEGEFILIFVWAIRLT